MTWLSVAGSILALLLFLARWIVRVKSEKRKLADEASKELEDAQKNKDVSGRIDAWGKLRRLR